MDPTTNDTIIVTVKAVASSAITNSSLKIYLTETLETWATPAPNGVNRWEFPFVSASPSVAGIAFTHTGTTTDTLTFTARFAPRRTGTEPYNKDSCSVIAFVQNNTSHEVYQSARCHTIVSPTNNRTYLIGTALPIIWNPYYTTDIMNILINRSYPSGTWDTIAANIPNSGYFDWTATGPITYNARLLVKSTTHPLNVDTSIITITSNTTLQVSPNPISMTVAAGDTVRTNVLISNNGSAPFTGTLAATTGSLGYTSLSSSQAYGPEVGWYDTEAGDPGAHGDDSLSGPYVLPFRFPFYGTNYTNVYMCTNGYLCFSTAVGALYTNASLPSGYPMICPYWDDFVVSGTAVTQVYVDADSGYAIFSWQNVPRYVTSGSGGNFNFEAILRSDGTVEFQYDVLTGTLNSATIGISNGTIATQVIYNQTATQYFAYKFTPGVIWSSPSTTVLSIPVGQSQTISTLFDARRLTAGQTLNGTWVITGNMAASITVPVSIITTATGVAENGAMVHRYNLENAYPNPFNPTTSIRYEIPRADRVVLKLYDSNGRLVETLFDGTSIAGKHTQMIDATKLASGMYFVKMNSGNFNATKKIMLVK